MPECMCSTQFIRDTDWQMFKSRGTFYSVKIKMQQALLTDTNA